MFLEALKEPRRSVLGERLCFKNYGIRTLPGLEEGGEPGTTFGGIVLQSLHLSVQMLS